MARILICTGCQAELEDSSEIAPCTGGLCWNCKNSRRGSEGEYAEDYSLQAIDCIDPGIGE